MATRLDIDGNAKPLSFILKFGWGMGSFSSSTMYQATTVLLLHYLVDEAGIAAALAGALIGIMKIYDAFIDPFIGAKSDRTVSKAGRRRPYILLGGFVSAISFVALFCIALIPPGALQTAAVIAVLLLNTTGYAILCVPYMAMPAEMTSAPHARTELISYRVGGLAFGQISGSVLAPFLIGSIGGGAIGHALMGGLLGLVILAAAIGCYKLTEGAPETIASNVPEMSAREKWRLALGNRPFVVLVLVKLANLSGIACFFALMPFLFISALGLSFGDLGIYFGVQAPLLLISQPFWVRLSRRIGKKNLYFVAVSLYIVSTASWTFADAGEPYAWLIVRGLAVGFASGGLLLAGQAMLPDAIAHDYARTGLRREGLFAGVYTTVEKGGAAIAAVLIGMALSAIGFKAGGGAVVQTPETIAALKAFMFAPGFFNAISALILTQYRLHEGSPPTARVVPSLSS